MSRPRSLRMHPVERAVIEQRWRETAVNAEIHALIGGDGQKLANEAGRVLFVVLGAALADGLGADDPDIRVVRGAVNAIYDQVDEPEVDGLRRASIVSGLQAGQRVLARVPRKAVIDAACDLALKLRRRDVLMSDFIAILEGAPTC